MPTTPHPTTPQATGLCACGTPLAPGLVCCYRTRTTPRTTKGGVQLLARTGPRTQARTPLRTKRTQQACQTSANYRAARVTGGW